MIIISQQQALGRTCFIEGATMNIILLVGLSFSLICYLNGLEEGNILNRKSIDLEALPLEKLLKMKKELQKKEHYPAAIRRTTTAAALVEQDATAAAPNAMALRRTAVIPAGPSADSSVQTAFQMSLTVLSFLAFGGYVITMVAQNMRKPQRNNNGMTAPLPLKAVVVNRNRRPSAPRPTGALATVSFGRRRKRSRRFSPLSADSFSITAFRPWFPTFPS